MSKKISITFEYDPTTDTIKNLKCDAEGLVKKTRAKKEEKEIVIENEAKVILEENKLVLNNKAILDMGLNTGDRIMVIWNKTGKLLLPYIGTDEMFEQQGGNKLTKSGTVSYRGAQNAVLADYGTEFTLKLEKDRWRLIPIREKEVAEVEEEEEEDVAFAQYEAIEVTEGDDNYDIDDEDLKFNL